MTHSGRLVQLNDLQEEVRGVLKVLLHERFVDGLLLSDVDGALDVIGNVGEDITDKLSEKGLILHDELGHVHLGEGRGEQVLFRLVATSDGGLTEDSTSETENGKNVSQTEIVMTLLGELFFTKFVENGELLVESVELVIADRRKLDLDDGPSVGHHHGDTTEEHFQVLGKLLTTGVTGVHRDEVCASAVESDRLLGVGREDELLELLLLGGGDSLDLSSDDGEGSKRDTVELIEATPET